MDTVRRLIQSAVAHTHGKAKVFLWLDAAKQHDAFWIRNCSSPDGRGQGGNEGSGEIGSKQSVGPQPRERKVLVSSAVSGKSPTR